ncbi:methylmalonyl Co-A mutase-associated GTPase MeaB [Rhodoligotrophos defluvii]|uniref:methylmalonyl Co-A mutase-associated GTPase MeaB n=1 Tax=Rhodoligotrophos defluvii TaxID=2561934 RepID=UPI00148560A4|nr:methylmalonyl Co-A mutase-associated GTPase MeaB [Rhodoligotrophos defluvii]
MDTAWRRRLSRAVSALENRAPGWQACLAEAVAAASDTLVVGVTGPPGAGKSTLVDAMAAHWAAQGHRVGILAVDPASPFSGGAILGDRVRMRRSEDLSSVFIRSMSTRGHSGGLNGSAFDICALMGGSGLTRVMVETVGVGQNEVEVAFVADCTVVVAVPGLGDSLQAAKAGLMEVGDVYAVNKSDLAGAASVAADIRSMLSLVFAGRPGANQAGAVEAQAAAVPGHARLLLSERFGDPAGAKGHWHPPVVNTAVGNDTSVAALIAAVEACGRWLAESGTLRQRRLRQAEAQMRSVLQAMLLQQQVERVALAGGSLSEWIEAVALRRLDRHTAAERFLAMSREGDHE